MCVCVRMHVYIMCNICVSTRYVLQSTCHVCVVFFCMYVYVCMHVYVMLLWIYIYMCVCVCVCVNETCAATNMACVCVCGVYVCVYVRTYAYMYMLCMKVGTKLDHDGSVYGTQSHHPSRNLPNSKIFHHSSQNFRTYVCMHAFICFAWKFVQN
jgi:hypothetical protein